MEFSLADVAEMDGLAWDGWDDEEMYPNDAERDLYYAGGMRLF